MMQRPVPGVWFSDCTSPIFGIVWLRDRARRDRSSVSAGIEGLENAVKHAWTASGISCPVLKWLSGLLRNLNS
jgi:hypothetical protein